MKIVLFFIFTLVSFNSFAEKGFVATEEFKTVEKYQTDKGNLVEQFIELSKDKFKNKESSNKFKDALKKLGNDFPEQVKNDIKALKPGSTVFDIIKNKAISVMMGQFENYKIQYAEAPSPKGDSEMARQPLNIHVDEGIIVDPTKATSK